MEKIPQRPEGNTPEAIFMKWVWESIARRLRIKSTPQYDVSYTPDGTFLTIKNRPGGKGGSPAQDAAFKGVYVYGESYDSLQWVVVQNGPVYGAYICTADSNTNAPWTGINWINFSSLNQWF